MTVPKIETTYVSGDRWYVDPGTGDKVPGVSAILNMMPKPALVRWAAKETAQWAVANLSTVQALAESDKRAAIDLLKGAPWRKSGKAADEGTLVHGLTERLMADLIAKRPSDWSVPTAAMSYLRNFARFAEEFEAQPVLVETTVWNDVYEYAGTFDGLYWLTVDNRRVLALVDTKTGASGVWPEAALQQTAYAHAPWYIDPETGQKHAMPPVEAAYALWLRPDGWALIPLSISESNWAQFSRLRDSYEWRRTEEKRAVGKAVNRNPLSRKWSGG